MSKKKKVVVTTSSAKTDESLEPTKSRVSANVSSAAVKESADMLFGRRNYMWVLGGIGLMVLGFALMAGGHMPSPDVWDPDLIYSFRRTVLAPIFILAGLGLQVVAIFSRK
ncbi:MAG: DUF3098 domain-containing protein [Saprospiraceae bacterium]|nr:DUF3098 domain-containing protein [Saprospiraceae bacterium]